MPRLRAPVPPTQNLNKAGLLEIPFSAIEPGSGTKIVRLPFDTLIDHVIVSGGQTEVRTEICKEIITRVASANLPFLVITSNRAYRPLVHAEQPREQITFYTIGEAVLQFAFNPFELLPNVTVAAHIARLTKVFRNIYDFSEPVACAFEKTIETAYVRRGWNLMDNANKRLTPEQDDSYHGDIYPLLSELLEVLDDGIEACGFEWQIKADVKSNVQAILNPLVSGINRSIFNTRSSSSISELFERAYVLETTVLRTPQDRALFTALILNLCEENLGASSNRLQHLILIDDCGHLPELFGKTHNSSGESNSSTISVNLQEFTNAGHGIIFSGIRGAQLSATKMTQCGMAVILRERNTFALSSLGGFANLDLATMNSIKAIGPYDMLILAGDEKPETYALDPSVLSEVSTTGTVSDETLIERCKQTQVDLAPLKSIGAHYFAEAFDLDSIALAEKLVQNKYFYRVFVRYVASFTNDLTQLVHFRAQVIHEIQRIIGKKSPEALRKISWCAISMASDKYFGDKALGSHWTLDEEREMLHKWYELLAPAFVPETVNPSLSRRLNIAQVRTWRDKFLELGALDQGPLPACSACTSKCLFGYDVAQFLADPGLFFDFNSTISRRDTPASESSAWFVRLLCERLIAMFNIDLAYCLAVHLIKAQSLSTDAQLVLLRKVRQHLLVEHSGGDGTTEKTAKTDEVRIIQFPNIKDR